MEKLIIIRGPSGAGKSTVARELLKRVKQPTMLVAVDKIRMSFSDQKTPNHQATKNKTVSDVLFGLNNGYDVILEGILNLKTEKPYLDEIFKVHPTENHFFYLDVSYNETVRRHQSRPEKALFSEAEMKEWWGWSIPAEHASEKIIPESSTLEQTLRTIAQSAGLELSNPA